MFYIKEENPTRRQILEFLKKKGPATTEQLSRALSITPMGVRQHLLTLERKGLVGYKAQKVGVGRPRFIYFLTEDAEGLFPKNYSNFSLALLKSIEKLEGRKKIKRYLKEIKEQMIGEFNDNTPEGLKTDERLKYFVEFLNSKDYIVDYEEKNGTMLIKNYNCPYYKIVKEYPELCEADYEMYKEALGVDLQRLSCIKDNSNVCVFQVKVNSV